MDMIERSEYFCEDGNDYCIEQFLYVSEALEYAKQNERVKEIFEYKTWLNKEGFVENAECNGLVWKRSEVVA